MVAGITVLPGVSSRAPDMLCSSKAQASRDIGKMMEILPLRGWDISNLSSSSTSKTSNKCSIPEQRQRQGQNVPGDCAGIPGDCSGIPGD
jgi:hypothetical protein